MAGFLEAKVAAKRLEVARAREVRSFESLERELGEAPPVRDFVEALAAEGVGLIAEVKKASPSAGVIREDFDPVAIAEAYAAGGAACLSCLTDEPDFQGKLAYLTAIREAVALPLMRKDFLIDRYQILEARVAGADCVLLIAECLDDAELADLDAYARELGMARLIEIHEPENLERVLRLEPPLLGVNNRNLATLETHLEHTIEVAAEVPAEVLLVSESGISSPADVARLQAAGVRGILVGESLMRAADVAAAVRALLGRE